MSDIVKPAMEMGPTDGLNPIASEPMPIAGDHLRRKLAVILASDVAGYSALVAADEEGTVRRYSEISRLMHTLVTQQSGRVFNTAGDAILAEFDSAVNAVRCAIDLQEAVNAGGSGEIAGSRVRLRIGIAIGDVIVADNGDLLGDGVNIAARLEGLSTPGGVCISRDVLNLVQSKIGLGFDDLGPQDLKNIPQPVHAFRVTATGNAPQFAGPPSRASLLRTRPFMIAGVAVAALVVAGVAVASYGLRRAPTAAFARLDPARIPLIPDAAREQVRRGYMTAGGHKAISMSFDGDSLATVTNRATEQEATTQAQAQCDKDSAQTENKRPCFIYAVGDRVQVDLASFPLPPPIETPMKPVGRAFGVDDPPLQRMNQGRRLLRDYPPIKEPKALAIGTRGDAVWGAMSKGTTNAEAARRALEFCGFRAGSGGGSAGSGNPSIAGGRTGPCILYAVGDDLVTLPPKSRKIVGVLAISTDPAIPSTDRERLIKEYVGDGWQALARGRGGTWHAAAGGASEAAVSEAALAKCRTADKDCQLYAIGRFLVAPEAG